MFNILKDSLSLETEEVGHRVTYYVYVIFRLGSLGTVFKNHQLAQNGMARLKIFSYCQKHGVFTLRQNHLLWATRNVVGRRVVSLP